MILLEVSNFWVIALSVIMFLVVMLLLVALLLYARAKLVPSGPVKININDEKELEVNAGDTLLTTLSRESIYLPVHAGGGRNMCTVQVPGA